MLLRILLYKRHTMQKSTLIRIGLSLLIACSLSAFLYINLSENGIFSSFQEIGDQSNIELLPDTDLVEQVIQQVILVSPDF